MSFFANSLPNTAYTVLYKSPSPGVLKRSSPSIRSCIDISGCDTATLSTRAATFIASVASFFKNFLLAGTFPKRFSTTTVVPSAAPTSVISTTLPPSAVSIVATGASFVLLIMVIDDTDEMAARASPRKPSVIIESRSSLSLILLVA